MDYIKWLNVDKWWKVVLWLGVAFEAIALLFYVQIVNPKHLLGLGFGMIMIGLSMWGAQTTCVKPMPELNGFFEGKAAHHNWMTLLGVIVGGLITALFLTLIIIGLV